MLSFCFWFFGIGVIFLSIGLETDIAVFFNLPSFVIVTLVPLLLTAGYFGHQALVEALRVGITNEKCSKVNCIKHQHILQTLRNLFSICGAIGFLIGLVMMLQNLEDPAKIGPAMAIAILTVFYGLVLGELLVAPLTRRLALQGLGSVEGPDIEHPNRSAGRGAVVACVVVLANQAVLANLLSLLN